MNLDDIRPKPTERMLLVGATGTGKTTLARAILKPYNRVLVIDPKGTYDPEDERYRMVRSLPGLRFWQSTPRLHYRPGPGADTTAHWDSVYRWAYDQRDIMVYTDETYLTMRHTQSPDWQRAVVTCGRERGTGAIFASQRPRGIDVRILSESEHRVCFYLENHDDRKRMSETMGEEVMTDPVLAARQSGYEGEAVAHAFWYWNVKSRRTKLCVLSLSRET